MFGITRWSSDAGRSAPVEIGLDCSLDTFDTLIEQETGYTALDARIIKTVDQQDQLLAMLKHPDIPLHNNDVELGARQRVRKRDVSFGPQSRTGAYAWDTFQILVATAIKLDVGLFHSLRDRMVAPATTSTLAERVVQQASIMAQPVA